MTTFIPAEVFHPGEFLKEELEEREWTQADLATITDTDRAHINGVIKGKRPINAKLSVVFSKAFGSSAEYWLRLQAAYDAWMANQETKGQDTIERRARLYTFPIREIIRRGWIEDTKDPDVLEHQVATFFSASSVDKVPVLSIAARRTRNEEPLTPSQIVWLYRAKQLAEACEVSEYSTRALRKSIKKLRAMRISPEATRDVPKVLAGCGIRFVVVEGLSGLKADGVCFWLKNKHPVIALSLRHDRIDNFWFTLRHELEHVLRGHGKNVALADVTIDSSESTFIAESKYASQQEVQANEAAAEFCVEQNEVEDCIGRLGPNFSSVKLEKFSRLIGVHPGLLVGQLHRRGDMSGGLPYTHMRKLLVPVRQYVLESSMVDGWGTIPPHL